MEVVVSMGQANLDTEEVRGSSPPGPTTSNLRFISTCDFLPVLWLVGRQNRHLTSGPKRSHFPFFRATVLVICINCVSSIESRALGSLDLAASVIRFNSWIRFRCLLPPFNSA